MNVRLDDELGRLAALRRYEILDTPAEAPFERLTGLVRAVLDVPISTLSLIDEDRQFYKSCVGMDGSDTPREQSFCTHTIQMCEPLHVPDTWLDERFAHYPSVTGAPFIRSYLGVPLTSSDGYNLGALCALDVRPREFDAAKIEVLKSFAALAVNELELRRIAQLDSLTGTATRRSFLLEVEKAIARFVRHGKPSALLAIDLDHFKQINDTYGHPAGDQVLRSVSRQFESLLRTEDVLGRLGGEEFGILLADADLEQAALTAERLRHALDSSQAQSEPLRVTASFGIATLGYADTTPDAWLFKADQALYSAKRSGRNRCCIADVEQLLKTA